MKGECGRKCANLSSDAPPCPRKGWWSRQTKRIVPTHDSWQSHQVAESAEDPCCRSRGQVFRFGAARLFLRVGLVDGLAAQNSIFLMPMLNKCVNRTGLPTASLWVIRPVTQAVRRLKGKKVHSSAEVKEVRDHGKSALAVLFC